MELRLKDMLEEAVDEKFYLTPKQVDNFQNSDFAQRKLLLQRDVSGTLLARDYKEPKCVEVGYLKKSEDGTKHQSNTVYSTDGVARCTAACDYKSPMLVVDSPDYESVIPVNDNYVMLNGGKIGKMLDISRRAYYEDSIAPTIHTSGGGNQEAKVIISDQQIIDNIPNSKAYIKRKAQETLDEKGYLPEFYNPYHNSEVKEISPTIATSCGNEAGVGTVLYKHNFRIRKLTPKEYWRLMGFDDIDFEKAKSAGISNTQLYKQAGNSIVVNVLQYIFRSLFNKGVK